MFSDVLIQIIGFLGYGVVGASYLQKKKAQILIFNIIASVLLAIHYYLLGGITGSLCNLLGTGVLIFIYFYEKNKGRNVSLELGVILAGVLSVALITWNGFDSILPVLASLVIQGSFVLKKEQVIRILAMIGATLYLIYAIIYSSYSGIIAETIIIIATLIGIIMWQYHEKNQSKQRASKKKPAGRYPKRRG